MTTFSSYGQIPAHPQSELIREIAARPSAGATDALADMEAAFARLRDAPAR